MLNVVGDLIFDSDLKNVFCGLKVALVVAAWTKFGDSFSRSGNGEGKSTLDLGINYFA